MKPHDPNNPLNSPEFQEEWLSAYLDGELSAVERQVVEDRLESDSTAKQLIEELRRIRSLVATLPVWGEDIGSSSGMNFPEPRAGNPLSDLDDGLTSSQLVVQSLTPESKLHAEPSVRTSNAGISNAGISNAGISNAGISNAGISNAGISNAGRSGTTRSARSGVVWYRLAIAACLLLCTGIGMLLWSDRLDNRPAIVLAPQDPPSIQAEEDSESFDPPTSPPDSVMRKQSAGAEREAGAEAGTNEMRTTDSSRFESAMARSSQPPPAPNDPRTAKLPADDAAGGGVPAFDAGAALQTPAMPDPAMRGVTPSPAPQVAEQDIAPEITQEIGWLAYDQSTWTTEAIEAELKDMEEFSRSLEMRRYDASSRGRGYQAGSSDGMHAESVPMGNGDEISITANSDYERGSAATSLSAAPKAEASTIESPESAEDQSASEPVATTAKVQVEGVPAPLLDELAILDELASLELVPFEPGKESTANAKSDLKIATGQDNPQQEPLARSQAMTPGGIAERGSSPDDAADSGVADSGKVVLFVSANAIEAIEQQFAYRYMILEMRPVAEDLQKGGVSQRRIVILEPKPK